MVKKSRGLPPIIRAKNARCQKCLYFSLLCEKYAIICLWQHRLRVSGRASDDLKAAMAVLFCFYKYDRIMIPPGHLPCGSQKEVYPDDIEQGAQTQALSAYGGSLDDRDVCGAAACLFREGFGRGDGGLYRKTLRHRQTVRLRRTAEDEQEHPIGGSIRCAEAGSRLQKIPVQGQQKHQNGVPFAGDLVQHKEAFCKGFSKPLRSFTF